jgi:hypothetical protein
MDILLAVVAVDTCVLGLAFVGLYFLNKAVEQNDH